MQGRHLQLAISGLLFLVTTIGYGQTIQRVIDQNKVGIQDSEGKLIIPTEYEDLGWTSDSSFASYGESIGYKAHGYWGLLSLQNERLTPARYYTLFPISQNSFLASERKNYLRGPVFGVFDSEGETIIPFRYYSLTPYGEYFIGRRWIDNQLRFGLIHPQKGTILPFEYQHIEVLDDTLLSVTNTYGKTGLYHINQQWVTGFLFDKLQPFQGEYAEIYSGGKLGLINRQGQVVLDPEYKSVTFISRDSVQATRYPTWWAFTKDRDTIQRFEAELVGAIAPKTYQLKVGMADVLWNDSTGVSHLPGYNTSLDRFENGLATMTVDDSRGAINLFGQTIVPPQYDTVFRTGNYFFAAQIYGDSLAWDVWNSVGHQLNHSPYEAVLPLREGFFPVQQYGRWGFMTPQGKITLACIYDSIPQPFKFGHAVVQFHGLEGIIDTAGSWVRIPAEGNLSIISPSLYRRQKGHLIEIRRLGDNSLFFRATGRLEARPDGFLMEEEGKLGLKNWAGEWIVSPNYDSLSLPIAKQFYAYQAEGESGILTLSGQRALKGSEGFQSLYPVTEGFYPVKISDRFGFVDEQARLRVANRYDSVAAFSEGIAAVKLRGRWGAIDEYERLVIQPTLEAHFFMVNGQAIVKQDGKYGILDASGRYILPAEYDEITPLPSGYFLAKAGDRYGLLHPEGHEILQPRYSQLAFIPGQGVIIEKRNTYGVLNPQGKDLIPTLFEFIEYDSINHLFLAKQAGTTIGIKLQP